MKTYEEMARDVLRRRDEELARTTQTSQINPPPEVVYPAASKKRGKLGLLPKIAIPCAATILIGAVGLTAWKNLHRGRYVNLLVAEENQPGTPETSDGVVFTFASDEPESIYKGGNTEIYINEVEDWNSYSFPLLSEEDFCPIDDDKINNYYGMEFDRLSRVFPDWKSEHEPFGIYAHDEFNAEVASHRIIYTINRIDYTTDNNGSVCVVASLIEKYDAATAENAKPSIINGFDAMIYKSTRIGNYAADIDMGSARVTISALDIDEEEFLNILDVYTAPDKGSDDNNNHNQTMEDKIVILDEAPEFIKTNSWPFKLASESDEDLLVGSELIRYSMSELNDLYGINFGCLSELHPDWLKMYTERDLGIRVRDFDDIKTENMASSGGRAILRTENRLGYQTDKGVQIQISATLSPLTKEDLDSSVVNGYNAVIFQKLGNNEEVFGYGAAVQMKGTLVFITATNQTEDEFIDLVREYTSEASKFKRSSKPLPTENKGTTFTAVDYVDSRIKYEVDFSVESYWLKSIYNEELDKSDLHGKTMDIMESNGYLQEFLKADMMSADGRQPVYDFKRNMSDGSFNCYTQEGTKFYSPVDGKVVAVCDGSWYNGGLGKAVAVEFGDEQYIIIGHLDEINVEVGDYVDGWLDVLGVCGRTGFVQADQPPMLTLIALQKVYQ